MYRSSINVFICQLFGTALDCILWIHRDTAYLSSGMKIKPTSTAIYTKSCRNKLTICCTHTPNIITIECIL